MTPIVVLLGILAIVLMLARIVGIAVWKPTPPAIVTTQGDVIPLIEPQHVTRNGIHVRIFVGGTAREVKCQSAARARVLEAAARELQPLPAETAAQLADRAIAITRKTPFVRKR